MATPNAQSPGQPIVPIPAFIYNHDLVGVLDVIGRFIVELVRSDSSNRDIITEADAGRWNTYLDSIDIRQSVIISAPTLDLPQTSHSIKWPVEPLDPIPSMNNDEVESLIRIFTVQHAELANSTSSQASSGMSSFDSIRLTALTAKTRAFLAAYRLPPAGLDQPASSPWDETTPVPR